MRGACIQCAQLSVASVETGGSAVKSNFTNWCCQNLSKRAVNALTVQASSTELGKLFQIFTMRAEKNAFVSHNDNYDFANYSGCLWC